jgi:hypothetical protein
MPGSDLRTAFPAIGTRCFDAGPAFQPGEEERRQLTAPDWLLQSYLELAAVPSAVPCVRRHTRLLVSEWGLAALAETAELLVAEIVTNAVQASSQVRGRSDGAGARAGADGPPPVRCWLAADQCRVLIQVWDSCPWTPPRRPEPGPDAESGRGLLLIEALSSNWGWYRPIGSTGKVVWAVCAASTSRA